jgi:hypothetical protein
MLFSDYTEHNIKEVNPKLLWEYDLTDFNYHDMRNVVVQRVVERGWPDDFYAILNLYGHQGVREAIKEIPTLNKVDTNFVSVVFNIPLNELKCYNEKQSKETHRNY